MSPEKKSPKTTKKHTKTIEDVPAEPKAATDPVQKSDIALAEEQVLAFWRDRNIFQKSLDKQTREGDYVFYDGPPFATGLPHYGHILVSTIKDAVPRYWTMRGKHVERRWGWDCHGLPIENIVEKDLKVSGKKEIEALPGGVEEFNEYARSKVLDYVSHWKETIERMGRWVDFDGSYKTMDNTFIESVWWALKEMWDKKLIYEGTKVLPYCPRCETPISSSEIAMDNSYKDITDISVYVKLELFNRDTDSVEEAALQAAGMSGVNGTTAKTYLVAWTTTPWTLPGNTAAAVNKDIVYVKVRVQNAASQNAEAFYIFAKEKLAELTKKFGAVAGSVLEGAEVVDEFSGQTLVGLTYKPMFNFFANPATGTQKTLPHKENGWKVYAAPYVTTEAGTGIVHLAPGYGEEDMALANEHQIPFVLHVGPDGKFTKELSQPLEDDAHTVLAGLSAKPKPTPEDPNLHQSSDIIILKHLAKTGLLFGKEKIVHSYPHCHRCETPLYYFALRAWFVRIQEAKKDLLAQNEKINWVPEHLKHGRFGKGIESAPDWNISRNRYWASPLPFWHCETCGKTDCIGSLADLKARTKAQNTYFVMRHAESEANVANKISSKPESNHHLTDLGKTQAKEAAEKLRGQHIDLIVTSDLARAHETATIVAETLGLSKEAVIQDARLRELQVGDQFEGKTWDEYRAFFKSSELRFTTAPEGGETLTDLQRRSMGALFDIEHTYSGAKGGKKVLFVTHGDPAFFMSLASFGMSQEEVVQKFVRGVAVMGLAEFQPLSFSPFPHNKNFALDFHRPYIDEITFACSGTTADGSHCPGTMKRIPEVIDCWFESGSMPFAQHHYPFENKEKFDKNFPAQFIVEYIAQTRTWFYYTHAVSTLLFGKNSFENVIAHGTVLAEDGQKMSKSKGNFPDPHGVFNKYGVDALRFYLLSSPLMKSEDLFFSEKGVDEACKKIVLRLKNVVSFYEMYKPAGAAFETVLAETPAPQHVLDRWILARLNALIMFTTQAMDSYEIDRALAPIDAFLEDLSVWYVRRSRERLKDEHAAITSGAHDGKNGAIHTFFFVLREFSKIIAPFTPFIAEEVHTRIALGPTTVQVPAIGTLSTGSVPTVVDPVESVHLETWPEPATIDEVVLGDMAEARQVVSFALEARARAGIKVRQPLSRVVIKDEMLKGKQELLDLIADEINVKAVQFDPTIKTPVQIDTTLTDELRDEGNVRDLVRAIQDARKKSGCNPGDLVTLVVSTKKAGVAFIEKYKADIAKGASLKDVVFENGDSHAGEEIKLDVDTFVISIKK